MTRFIVVMSIEQDSEEALRATVNLAGDNIRVHLLEEIPAESHDLTYENDNLVLVLEDTLI